MIRDLSVSCTEGRVTPSPSFVMFQCVRSNFCLDGGGVHDSDVGVVTGMRLAKFTAEVLENSGWCYYVTWLVMPSSPWLPLPHTNLIHESELSPVGDVLIG